MFPIELFLRQFIFLHFLLETWGMRVQCTCWYDYVLSIKEYIWALHVDMTMSSQ